MKLDMKLDFAVVQAEAEARERHWQSEVQGLQSKVEKLEGLLQREMGHHQINSPTPRPVYDLSPVGLGQPHSICSSMQLPLQRSSVCACASVTSPCSSALPWQHPIRQLTIDACLGQPRSAVILPA